MEGGETAALKPVGEDRAEEAELRKVKTGLGQKPIDSLCLETKIASLNKPKNFIAIQPVKPGQAFTVRIPQWARVNEAMSRGDCRKNGL